jgi:hypothetical protein
MIDSDGSAVLMNGGPLQSKINQTFERFNRVMNIVANCEKIVFVFVFDMISWLF